MIRCFDVIIGLAALFLLMPLFMIISVWIVVDSGLPVFFKQQRVGKNHREFQLLKFRTMYPHSDKKGPLTIGFGDKRITRVGRILRRFKLDELPQLFNVLSGEMSMVGPRPEVRKFVNLYTEAQKQVLTIKPGITDWASIEYVDENEILAATSDPEKMYIEVIMPHKIELNLRFIQKLSIWEYFRIIFATVRKLTRV